MSMPVVFSLLFYTAFCGYLLLGIYILWLNPRNMLNRVFFAATLSLSAWAFCFAMANSAPDYETSLLWRRAASIGWGTAYSVLLHFILILTERTKLLQQRWLYIILYVPVLVNIYAFGISPAAAERYDLVFRAGGWINVPLHTPWDQYFNIYYISFSLVGLFLIGQWGMTTREADKKRQSLLLILAFAVAVVLGTLTDVIVNSFLELDLPQMAPVATLIPVAAIFYSIRRYGLMGRPAENQTAEPGKILSEGNLNRFYEIMSLLFVAGGLLTFAVRHFLFQFETVQVFLFSSVLLLIGLVLQIIQKLPANREIKDMVFVILVSASIPFTTLSFLRFSNMTVWMGPIAFIVLSVIFNRRRMIYWLGASAILTQICAWFLLPSVSMRIDGFTYATRITMLAIIVALALYVNRIYIRRLEENEAQISYLKMTAKISADFVTVTALNQTEKIQLLLEESGTSLQVDRCLFYLIDEDQKTVSLKQGWQRPGVSPPEIRVFNWSNHAALPIWLQHMRGNEAFSVTDVAELPPEAATVKEQLLRERVESLVAIPVMSKGKVLGILSYEMVGISRAWRKEERNIMDILANLLADALTKVEAEKEISYLAYYDALTDLPNRTLFKKHLEKAIHLAKRTETLVAVLFLDLDAFKGVNDALGHEGGDELLKEVGARMSRSVRRYDTVARFGGDEFLVNVMNLTKVEDVHTVARKILHTFKQPILIRGQEFFISASMGVAVYPQDGEDADQLIKNADLALDKSKARGKNQYTLCTPILKDDLLRKMKLTNSLFRALERNELELHYQPQVKSTTGEIIGVEALLRWEQAELGSISPSQFIPLAEQTGIIHAIGFWVIETACVQNKKWQQMGLPPVRMSVNLSVGQFKNPRLVKSIAQILERTGLEARYLELEVTESVAVEEGDEVIRILHQLKALGVSIAIDDFGTDYSSLDRLKMLPVDRIKIAMSFIHGITEDDSKDKSIASIIIQLAKSLKLAVIAEGVETNAQLAFLKEQRCDEIQGYYYYKPMKAEDMEGVLAGK